MSQLPQIAQSNRFNESELKAALTLSDEKKALVLAKNEARIVDLEPGVCLQSIYGLIVKAIELSGQSKKYGDDPAVLKNVSKFVYNFVTERYKGLTLAEINNAFNSGISEEYGDYVGFGVSTFTKFINGYMASSKRAEAMKDWLSAQDEPAITDKPMSDVFKPNMDLALEFFEIFKENPLGSKGTTHATDKSFYHLPTLFTFLDQHFEIPFKPETQHEIKENAKKQYWEYMKDSGMIKRPEKKAEMQTLIDSVKIETNRTFEYYVAAESLRALFRAIIERGKTIKDLKRK